MEDQQIPELIDGLANRAEDGVEEAAEQAGLSADEIIDRLANELKARKLGD